MQTCGHDLRMDPTHKNVSRCNNTELQVFRSSLLKFSVGAPQIVVGAEYILNQVLNLWKEVDKLDVGGQQKGPSISGTQVILEWRS